MLLLAYLTGTTIGFLIGVAFAFLIIIINE